MESGWAHLDAEVPEGKSEVKLLAWQLVAAPRLADLQVPCICDRRTWTSRWSIQLITCQQGSTSGKKTSFTLRFATISSVCQHSFWIGLNSSLLWKL